jgi:small subunit ribosomal protein S6
MVILDPDLEERTIAPSLDTFLNVVRNGGGTVEKVDVWGRRRLSFEIDKKTEGIYAVVDLNAEPATMKELDRQLNLNESILRTKVMRPEMRASRAQAPKAPKAAGTSAPSGPSAGAPTGAPAPVRPSPGAPTAGAPTAGAPTAAAPAPAAPSPAPGS